MKTNRKKYQPRLRGPGWLSVIVALALIVSNSGASAQLTVEEVVAYCPGGGEFDNTYVMVRMSEFSYVTDLSRFSVIPEGGGDAVRPWSGDICCGDLRTWFLQFPGTEVPPGSYRLLFEVLAPVPFQVQCETTPPTVVSVQPNFDGSVLTVTFREPMDMFFNPILDPFAYSVDESMPPSEFARIGPTGFNSVEVPFFPTIFPGPHALYIYSGGDLSFNLLAESPTVVPFTMPLPVSESISAVAVCNGTEIVVRFRDPVNPQTATDPFFYTIRDAAGTSLIIADATLAPDGQAVTLRLSEGVLDPGSVHLLTTESILTPAFDFYGGLYRHTLAVQFAPNPPTVSSSVAVSSLFPVNNGLVNVGLNATSSESDVQIQVFSDEPEVAALDDATLADGVLELRARRNPGSDGRVYLIVVTSTNPCGNVGVACATVVVPKNSGAAALTSVQAQAAAAQAQCSATGSPLTPYRILP